MTDSQMMIPCIAYCYVRFGKQYTPECDTTCDYAKTCNELKLMKNAATCQTKLTEEEFVKLHCQVCGSKRCEGIGTEWFSGCKFKAQLKL